MNWTFHPKNEDLTTSLPLSVEITKWEGEAQVLVEGIGPLELRPSPHGLKADFYFTLPGTYTLTVKDAHHTEVRELMVEQHNYLNFVTEFGTFFVLFLFVMGGIVLWTRRIMKNKSPSTART